MPHIPIPARVGSLLQVLLEAASGLTQRDAEVMRGALRVLCNCLCGMEPAGPAQDSGTTPNGGAVVLHHPSHYSGSHSSSQEEEKTR